MIEWIDYRLPIFTFLRHELNEYPTPRNLNYLWNFGSLSGIVLIIMIVTGIVLAMHYTATVKGAYGAAIGTILGACVLLGQIAIGDWLTALIAAASLAG